MTVWWGLAGLLGLLGCCGLLRSHRPPEAAGDDPLARYPAAREPATPNADTAHTPLMTPAITPEMLARSAPPVPPGPVNAVPESGTMAGEIPRPTAAPDPRMAGAPRTQLKPAVRPAEPETAPRQAEIPAQQPPRAAEEQPEPAPCPGKPAGPQARPSPVSRIRGLVGKAKRLLRRGRE